MSTKREVKGRVKKVTVNHYDDGTADTEIILEDGTRIVYSDAAPIARGNEIIAIGRIALMREVMAKLHPRFFTSTGLSRIFLEFETPYSFIFPLDVEVIESEEIHDQTSGVTYKERKG